MRKDIGMTFTRDSERAVTENCWCCEGKVFYLKNIFYVVVFVVSLVVIHVCCMYVLYLVSEKWDVFVVCTFTDEERPYQTCVLSEWTCSQNMYGVWVSAWTCCQSRENRKWSFYAFLVAEKNDHCTPYKEITIKYLLGRILVSVNISESNIIF